MAKVLKQAVVQYDVNNLPQRLITQWVDDVTGEESFDNFKAMIEKFMV